MNEPPEKVSWIFFFDVSALGAFNVCIGKPPLKLLFGSDGHERISVIAFHRHFQIIIHYSSR